MTVLEARPGFTFGCDPELFIMNNDTEEFISAEGIIPGTKEEPHKVPGGAVQLDGIAAEFNIDPAETFEQFNTNISLVIRNMSKMLPKGHSLIATPSVTLSQKEWDKTSEKSRELGCTPDFNAWTSEVNTPPDGNIIPRMRTGSGHLHIGWTQGKALSDEEHLHNCNDLVKQFDWYLGAWSVAQDRSPVRRSLYGKAGACRYKDYGVEYRVLSNFWVLSTAKRIQVWNRMQKAIDDMSESFMPEAYSNMDKYLIQAINDSSLPDLLTSNFSYPIRSIGKGL